MSELSFVGLGLSDERGLSSRAWEALRAADEVFAEEYTATPLDGTWERLSAELHRRVQRLSRAELESERPILEALERSPHVVLLVVGDPFAATTHVALRLAAERAGHRWTYLPNASILTAAAGFLGLQPYRFGRTVSLPFPEPGFAPPSPLEQIAGNRERGLHSLVLLDLRPAEGKFLSGASALALLRERDPEGAVIPRGAPVAVAARVGPGRRRGVVRAPRIARPTRLRTPDARRRRPGRGTALRRGSRARAVPPRCGRTVGLGIRRGTGTVRRRGEERLGELPDPERSKEHHVRRFLLLGRDAGGTGGRRNEDHPELRGGSTGLAHERAGTSFGEVHVRDEKGRVVFPDQLEALGRPFRLAIHAEMVQSKEAPEQHPRLFVTRRYDRGRRRWACVDHSV